MRYWFAISCFVTAIGLTNAAPMPLTEKDISLMLRSGYSSDAVLRELSTRKFGDSLDSAAENQLKKAGEATTTSLAKNVAQQQQVGGTMFDHLKGDLVYWHEGSFVPFDDEQLERKKFYLLFFSAFWSKDGRQFTSRLVDYYNRVAPQHPEFEVVFFSADRSEFAMQNSDRSEFAMQNYVSQTSMPWPVVAYDKRDGKAGAIAAKLVHGIPFLILSDAAGRILSQTGENSPPDQVLADLDKVLATSK